MCGIFGIVSTDRVSPEIFAALGQLNTQRGNLAFGGITRQSQKSIEVFRYPMPFDATKVELTSVNFVLAHIRAPTGGQSKSLDEVHPLETSELFLAHNGIILNHTQFLGWKILINHQFDSQVIIGGIQQFLDEGTKLLDAIKNTVQQLDGQQACWLLHKPTSKLYFWRVMSPIYYAVQEDQFIFSSIKSELTEFLMEEGKIYECDINRCTLDVAGIFSYYSPYKL